MCCVFSGAGGCALGNQQPTGLLVRRPVGLGERELELGILHLEERLERIGEVGAQVEKDVSRLPLLDPRVAPYRGQLGASQAAAVLCLVEGDEQHDNHAQEVDPDAQLLPVVAHSDRHGCAV